MIIAMAGLPATGKSSIAKRLAAELPASVLNKDQIRVALFPAGEIEYSTTQDDFCVDVMLQVAEYMLVTNPRKVVIIDGRTFSRRYQLEEVAVVAVDLGLPLIVIECVCSDLTAKRRLEQDATSHHPAANRDYDLYRTIKARYEPITRTKLVVNTDDNLSDCVQQCLDHIKRVGGLHA